MYGDFYLFCRKDSDSLCSEKTTFSPPILSICLLYPVSIKRFSSILDIVRYTVFDVFFVLSYSFVFSIYTDLNL